mmetsp:Transcript_60422/g.124277  ORF Transcript_60422/g.124277 Transcript_60422/m.124277 type:complete len:246 (+) Transcript_60422:565-1302(+)
MGCCGVRVSTHLPRLPNCPNLTARSIVALVTGASGGGGSHAGGDLPETVPAWARREYRTFQFPFKKCSALALTLPPTWLHVSREPQRSTSLGIERKSNKNRPCSGESWGYCPIACKQADTQVKYICSSDNGMCSHVCTGARNITSGSMFCMAHCAASFHPLVVTGGTKCSSVLEVRVIGIGGHWGMFAGRAGHTGGGQGGASGGWGVGQAGGEGRTSPGWSCDRPSARRASAAREQSHAERECKR